MKVCYASIQRISETLSGKQVPEQCAWFPLYVLKIISGKKKVIVVAPGKGKGVAGGRGTRDWLFNLNFEPWAKLNHFNLNIKPCIILSLIRQQITLKISSSLSQKKIHFLNPKRIRIREVMSDC